MTLSQTSEYALRAIVWMAGAPQESLTTQTLARSTRVPPGYMAKVLQMLGRAGLVESQRGPNGGFRLACDPAELSVLAVINAVDPIRRITTCPLNLHAHKGHLCAMHRRLDDAIGTIEATFAASTIADLLNEPSPVRPLREQ